MNLKDKQILFYDGDCPFCNKTVAFVLKHKKNDSQIYFSALQSVFAKKTLAKHHIKIKMDTLYYIVDNKVYDKSTAAIILSKSLKFPYNLLVTFYIIPKFFRDWVYTQIANKRQQFSIEPFCKLLNEDDKKWFLE